MANEKWKKWYEKHKDEYLKKKSEYKKEYYQKNKETILEKHKEYRDTHKEEKHLRDKAYRDTHKDEIKEWKDNYHNTEIGRAKERIRSYKREDKIHNRGECTLTVEDLVEMWKNGCIYCGETDFKLLGADRIDNDKPHTKDNCVPCCSQCNLERQKKDFKTFYNQKVKKS